MKDSRRKSVVIAGAARTPIGVKCGTLSRLAAEDLAVLASDEAIRRSTVDRTAIDAAVGANVYQCTAPGTQDIYFPRNVALRCNLPEEAPALMVQRICGSGLQTIVTAMGQILLPNEIDDADVVLTFGAETMSRAPQICRAPRSKANFWEFVEGGVMDDVMLTSLNHDLASTSMMQTADEYGHRMEITRTQADEFAVLSHSRARHAYRESHFNGGDALRGMFAVDTKAPDGTPIYLARDECVRNTSFDVLTKLRGLTKHELVSPGNASEISDGAAAVLLASREAADKRGLPSRFEIVSYGVAGVDPRVMGRGPVPCIKEALNKARLSIEDIDLWEINEAFAAQFLGVEKELGLDREITNVNGGAIAIGHPLAATGSRLIVDLIYEMQRRSVRHGCASACIGGGQGVAIIVRDTQQK